MVVGPLTRSDIITFAQQFDPQPLHIDPEWAADHGPFGDVIASGIHTLALCWGSWVALGHLDRASAGGLGIEQVQFSQPVRAGDILNVHAEVATLRRTRKGKWMFALEFDVRNQHAERVITFRSLGLLVGEPQPSG